ncbi:MAG: N-acetylneuraminate synthase family protein [Treponema sp.]|jgi:sialic acid synthase SpsE|nr:N-acetylneuraminate synthase family protein [Treponema sp.]
MGSVFSLGNQFFSPKDPLIIAELGSSHNGDPVRAREMIAAAAEAGAGCVKFQVVYADEILHPNTGEVPLPGGKIRLYDRFRQLEAPPQFYAEMKEYAESLGLLFLCTPFGLKSAALLKKLRPKMVKIASPELNFTGLLREIASWNLPVLLSSGVSKLADIEQALAVLRKGTRRTEAESPGAAGRDDPEPFCLLHCVTSYPAPETDYNLRVLQSLQTVFGVPVGLSDHSLDPELVPVLALGQGASVIEKHFCLSRADPGLDDPIALPPGLFARMTRALRRVAQEGAEKTLAEISRERGVEFVEQVLGKGVKTLAPPEEANYGRTNRSIHALRDIREGEIIKAGDFAVLRSEKILRPGLAPSWEPFIAGRKARNFIPAGEGIRFEDI